MKKREKCSQFQIVKIHLYKVEEEKRILLSSELIQCHKWPSFSKIGLLVAFLSGIYAITIIIQKIISPSLAIGYTSIFVAIIFFAGVQLIFIGLLGEYIGKVLKNVNKEPQYSIDYIKLNESEK